VVEAAAASDVGRVVLTSSVAAIGAAPAGEVADESQVYRSSRGLIYGDAKHEGEVEALAAGARLGVEVVIVNPSYVLGVPVDRSIPGETSTRVVANYLLGRLPLIVDGAINIVDVEDVATGHLLAAERGITGGRYILGGYNLRWAELIDRLTALSGVRQPLAVMPTEIAALGRMRHELGIPGLIAPEAWILLASNWRYSSRKAARELGYRARPLDATLAATIDWYQDLIEAGALRRGPSFLSVSSRSLRIADRFGLGAGLRAAEHYVGRRLVAGT
jgi:dihydroflavonol-4-reductase